MATDLLSTGMVGLDDVLLGWLQRGKANVVERMPAQVGVLPSRLEDSGVCEQTVLEGLKQSIIHYKTGIGQQLLYRCCEPGVTGNWVMTCYLRH